MKYYTLPLLTVFLWMNYINPNYGYRNPTVQYSGAYGSEYDYLERTYVRPRVFNWTNPYHTRIPRLIQTSQSCVVTRRSVRSLRKGLTARFVEVCTPRYKFSYPTYDRLYYSDPRYLSSPIYR